MNFIKRLISVFRAVGSALLGVQSRSSADEDFTSTSVWPYVIVGIVCVLILVGILICAVRYSLSY